MSKILIFDTSVASENLGDLIILDAVQTHLKELFPVSHFLNTPTHDVISRTSYRLNIISDYSFVAGTNLLSSNMNVYNQWKVNLFDAIFLKNILLVGVGWWQYQKDPNFYTKILLKQILHADIIHSVRDNYTLSKLNSAGFFNVINTGCPTTWNLSPDFCKEVPQDKSQKVVFTLTDYNKNEFSDNALIKLLLSQYAEVYFWPQGTGDMDYIKSLDSQYVKIIPPSLENFDELLSEEKSIDYVGTRLHAGIRALQCKKRSIILAVDNRAVEKNKDMNLPVVDRHDIVLLESKINSNWPTEIKIDQAAIQHWKGQFKK